MVAQRVGNPSTADLFMGPALPALTLEAAHRSVGSTLPIIGLIFIAFTYFGPWMPGASKHGGSCRLGIINHLYMILQGIYGIAKALVSFLFIAPGLGTMGLGLVLMLPILLIQLRRRKATTVEA